MIETKTAGAGLPLTSFALKIIAMTTMVIDHIGFRFIADAATRLPYRVIGRVAFILYAFLIAESFYHIKKKPDRVGYHAVKLLVLCLISEFPYNYMSSGRWLRPDSQSVMPTLALGFIALAVTSCLAEKITGAAADQTSAGHHGTAANAGQTSPSGLSRFFMVICVAAIWIGTALVNYRIKSNYSFAGIFLIGLFYLYLRKADSLSFLGRAAAVAGVLAAYMALLTWSGAHFGGWEAMVQRASELNWWYLGMALPIIPILLYNRQLGYAGRGFRYVYTWFYPVHQLIFGLIATPL